jgi:hypothetical protein
VHPLTYGVAVAQLSFFSADLVDPAVEDLAGILAAHGQLVTTAGATRVSVVVEDRWRATELAELVRACGIEAETGVSEEGRPLVRSAASAALGPLRASWTKGAVKTVPPGWVPGGRALRAWTLAAGRVDDAGFVLGLDPHAVDTHLPLAAALSRAGLAATLLSARGGGPGLRVSGRRRLLRLAETVGVAPEGAAGAGAWPDPDEVRRR